MVIDQFRSLGGEARSIWLGTACFGAVGIAIAQFYGKKIHPAIWVLQWTVVALLFVHVPFTIAAAIISIVVTLIPCTLIKRSDAKWKSTVSFASFTAVISGVLPITMAFASAKQYTLTSDTFGNQRKPDSVVSRDNLQVEVLPADFLTQSKWHFHNQSNEISINSDDVFLSASGTLYRGEDVAKKIAEWGHVKPAYVAENP